MGELVLVMMLVSTLDDTDTGGGVRFWDLGELLDRADDGEEEDDGDENDDDE